MLRGPRPLRRKPHQSPPAVRAFLACVVDFIPAWPLGEATLLAGSRPLDVTPRPRPDDQFWFVTTSSLSADSMRLADAYDLQVVDSVSGAAMAQAAQRMAARLQRESDPLPPPPPAPSRRRIRVVEVRGRSFPPRVRRRLLILDDD